jgi:hypothetical protein
MLFSDGKSFDNWHGFNMDEVPDCWKIEDGAFKVLTQGGEDSNKGLVTDKVYKDFALFLEFKVDEAANYAMYAPNAKPFKPAGDWNQAFLMVKDNKVTQILNGEIVVEYEKYSEEWTKLWNSGKWTIYPDYGKYDEGHIVLQNHSTTVWDRNIKLKEL